MCKVVIISVFPRPIQYTCTVSVYFTCYIYMCFYLHDIVASQNWLLGRLLPLMVGSYVPDGDSHWECYMQLLSIMVLVTAVEVTLDSVSELTMLVQDYLHAFNSLYPNKITPKMHYLLHLPDQMRK